MTLLQQCLVDRFDLCYLSSSRFCVLETSIANSWNEADSRETNIAAGTNISEFENYQMPKPDPLPLAFES
jgi:hypothetical protein